MSPSPPVPSRSILNMNEYEYLLTEKRQANIDGNTLMKAKTVIFIYFRPISL